MILTMLAVHLTVVQLADIDFPAGYENVDYLGLARLPVPAM